MEQKKLLAMCGTAPAFFGMIPPGRLARVFDRNRFGLARSIDFCIPQAAVDLALAGSTESCVQLRAVQRMTLMQTPAGFQAPR